MLMLNRNNKIGLPFHYAIFTKYCNNIILTCIKNLAMHLCEYDVPHLSSWQVEWRIESLRPAPAVEHEYFSRKQNKN